MKVRQVSNRGKNIIGHFPSIKLGRLVDFESLIERDYIYLIDFDRAVTWYAEQPLVIQYTHEGRAFTYTPDFHLLRHGRHILVEVKPEKYVYKPDNQRKFEAARSWCEARGWLFQIVTETEIRSGFRLQNLKRLTQFARYNVSNQVKEQILSVVGRLPAPVTIADVINAISRQSPQALLIPILHMTYRHQLTIPLDDALITPSSPIHLSIHQQEKSL